MKTYNTYKDVKLDLKRLDLERQISWQELKLLKNGPATPPMHTLNGESDLLADLTKFGVAFILNKVLD